MANIASAKKRARQDVKRNSQNASRRSMMRAYLKKIVNAIEAKDKAAASEAYKTAVPILDRMAGKTQRQVERMVAKERPVAPKRERVRRTFVKPPKGAPKSMPTWLMP